jgi:hypothetical protein
VAWGQPVPERAPGVYVISLSDDADAQPAGFDDQEPRPGRAPISLAAIQAWLDARPELRLDDQRPSAPALADRIAGFWLPDEVVLYIGLAGTSLRNRVNQYVKTPLGARRPHAGGHFLKTLDNLNALHVHWAPTAASKNAEDRMLSAFVAGVSDRTLRELVDPSHPFPFANLEWPPGTRKKHGLRGTKGDMGGPAPAEIAIPSAETAAGDRQRVEAGRPEHTGTTRQVTLHEEIERILREEGNRWMTTLELAGRVNEAGNYRKKDATPVTAFQIHGRTRNYKKLFERDGTRVRLVTS